jgi:sigma-B regulation protein RsbU (phosphoserine phosphatase)
VLFWYTDGLVERRERVIDIGLERLVNTVRPAPADLVCATVMAEAGVEQPTDDVALLALRRRPLA